MDTHKCLVIPNSSYSKQEHYLLFKEMQSVQYLQEGNCEDFLHWKTFYNNSFSFVPYLSLAADYATTSSFPNATVAIAIDFRHTKTWLKSGKSKSSNCAHAVTVL